MRATPKVALMGMLVKHYVSLMDMCMDKGDYPMEKWSEKITDSINYLLILRAVVEEEQDEEGGGGEKAGGAQCDDGGQKIVKVNCQNGSDDHARYDENIEYGNKIYHSKSLPYSSTVISFSGRMPAL